MKWIRYILILSGAFVFYHTLEAHSISVESSYWPSVQGKIKAAYVRRLQSLTPHSSSTYVAVIKYEYTVNSTTYTGDQYSFGTASFALRKTAEELIDAYEKISTTKVYYSRNNPQLAVLVPGPNWASLLLLMFISFTLFALAIRGGVLFLWFTKNILHLSSKAR